MAFMTDARSRPAGDCKRFANSKTCTTFVGGNPLTISMSSFLLVSDFCESDIVLHLWPHKRRGLTINTFLRRLLATFGSFRCWTTRKRILSYDSLYIYIFI